MQVWFLSGLASCIKGDVEAMEVDLKRARQLFEIHECEEPEILQDIDYMLEHKTTPPATSATSEME